MIVLLLPFVNRYIAVIEKWMPLVYDACYISHGIYNERAMYHFSHTVLMYRLSLLGVHFYIDQFLCDFLFTVTEESRISSHFQTGVIPVILSLL